MKSGLLALGNCLKRKCKAPFQANSVLSGVVLFTAVEHFLQGDAAVLAGACLQILLTATSSVCQLSEDCRSHVRNMVIAGELLVWLLSATFRTLPRPCACHISLQAVEVHSMRTHEENAT